MASEYHQLEFAAADDDDDDYFESFVDDGKWSLEVVLKRVQEQIQGKWPVRPEQSVEQGAVLEDQRKD